MAAMYRQGITFQKIGDHFKVTRQFVQQCLKRFGITSADGGQCKVAAVKKSNKRADFEARIMSRWGLPVEEWRALRGDGTIHRYERQKVNAKSRAIPFKLTFRDWLAIWQASGKLDLCGRGIGHYCMSRICDAGGYEVGNVHIQPSVENSRQAVDKWRGKVKANPGVFCLYPGRARPYLAAVGGMGKVRLGFFATEAEAVAARDAYLQQHPGLARGGLGQGKGWTLLPRMKTRPYQVQTCGTRSYHATQAEAEDAYRAAVNARLAEREAA